MFKSLSKLPTGVKIGLALIALVAFLALGGTSLVVTLIVAGFFSLAVVAEIYVPVACALVVAAACGGYISHLKGKSVVRGAATAASWTMIVGFVALMARMLYMMATGLH